MRRSRGTFIADHDDVVIGYSSRNRSMTGPHPYSSEYCPAELESVHYYGGRRYDLWEIGACSAPTQTWAEFGVGCGSSANGLTKLLGDDGDLFLFDSWEGIPDDWCLGDTLTEFKGQWSFPRFEQNDQRQTIVDGLYRLTLPFTFPEQLGLIHIDCDVYSSTRDVLFGCNDYIQEGTVLIFDEYWGYQYYADHEYKATHEWMDKTGNTIEWLGRTQFEAVGIVHT